MNAKRKILTLAAVAAGLGALHQPVNSQDKITGTAAVSVIQCKDRYFPNLPGQNAFLLRKEKAGTFTAVGESYGKPKTYPHLKCSFDAKDAKIFYCMTEDGLWGAHGERMQTTGVDLAGKETVFDGYRIEIVKEPDGDEPVAVMSLQFDTSKCATAPK